MSLITLKTFDNAFEAHLLKTKLENEGIPCYLFDETIMGLNPLFNSAIGGVKLKISALDQERTMVLLEKWEEGE